MEQFSNTELCGLEEAFEDEYVGDSHLCINESADSNSSSEELKKEQSSMKNLIKIKQEYHENTSEYSGSNTQPRIVSVRRIKQEMIDNSDRCSKELANPVQTAGNFTAQNFNLSREIPTIKNASQLSKKVTMERIPDSEGAFERLLVSDDFNNEAINKKKEVSVEHGNRIKDMNPVTYNLAMKIKKERENVEEEAIANNSSSIISIEKDTPAYSNNQKLAYSLAIKIKKEKEIFLTQDGTGFDDFVESDQNLEISYELEDYGVTTVDNCSFRPLTYDLATKIKKERTADKVMEAKMGNLEVNTNIREEIPFNIKPLTYDLAAKIKKEINYEQNERELDFDDNEANSLEIDSNSEILTPTFQPLNYNLAAKIKKEKSNYEEPLPCSASYNDDQFDKLFENSFFKKKISTPKFIPKAVRLKIKNELTNQKNSLECDENIRDFETDFVDVSNIALNGVTENKSYSLKINEEGSIETSAVEASPSTYNEASTSTDRMLTCEQCGFTALFEIVMVEHLRQHSEEFELNSIPSSSYTDLVPKTSYYNRIKNRAPLSSVPARLKKDSFSSLGGIKAEYLKVKMKQPNDPFANLRAHAVESKGNLNNTDQSVPGKKAKSLMKLFISPNSKKNQFNRGYADYSRKLFKCLYCSFSTRDKNVFNLHKKTHLKQQNLNSSAGVKVKAESSRYNCRICKRKFKSKQAVVIHKRSHTRNGEDDFKYYCKKLPTLEKNLRIKRQVSY